jgi:predicted O-linked N-acetylglucosamine transferase (SPINDLY family)
MNHQNSQELTIQQVLSRAKKATKQGKTAVAENLYNAILQQQPNHPIAKKWLNKLQKELPRDRSAQTTQPSQAQIDTLVNLYQTGQMAKVELACDNLLKSYSQSLEVINILGAANYAQGKFEEAIATYNKVLLIKPDYPEAHNNIAAAFRALGKFEEAIAAYNKALLIKPDLAEAHSNLGITLRALGRLEDAEASYRKAIALMPGYAEAHSNFGVTLRDLGRQEEAEASHRQAIAIKPDYAEAHNNLGATLQELDRIEEAEASYRQAIALKPDFAEAHNNLGITLREHGKLEDAEASHRKTIALKPDFADAHRNLGNTLQEQGKLVEAIEAFNKALHLNPDFEAVHVQMLHLQAHVCDWDLIEQDQDIIQVLGTSTERVEPFSALSLEDSPERHRLRSELYAKSKHKQQPLSLHQKPTSKPGRLRIGYFSADFKMHPVMFNLIGTLERHNPELFEIYAYSFGAECNDEMRQRTVKAVDVFVDVKDMGDRDIALRARQDKIDIAIDLSGYTQNSRTGIFAYRAAPVQINYLGYPGTIGADFIDYNIADQTMVPVENQRFFSEKLIYMPQFSPFDTSIPISEVTPSRAELGLPEEGFVFCAINNSYKLRPSDFDVWMRLLKRVEGSVLWLLEANKWCKANLIKEAEARGIKADRLVFQPRMVTDSASQSKYLAQFRQADLYLDTFIYGAGGTANNALWAGLPVLTKIGHGFTSRMAAGYLQSLELPELITTTDEAYEELAVELSINPKRIAALKQKLADKLISTRACDTKLFTRNLEEGYQQAYQRYFDGNDPKVIFVSSAKT